MRKKILLLNSFSHNSYSVNMSLIDKIQSVHIIGIGGISLSALALILLSKGKTVSGSDKVLSQITENLQNKGIKIVDKCDSLLIQNADLIVYTSAISADDEEFTLAKKLHKKILSRAELLGEISKDYFTISVAGSHGKTTATSMIGNIFIEAGKDPTIHVGGIMKNIQSNALVGKGKYFITEACEYKDSFLHISSDISIILNEDPDHLDYFKNKENYYKSFEKFAKNIKKDGVLIVNNDDFFAKKLKTANTFSYSIKNNADLQAKNIDQKNDLISFELYYLGLNFGVFQIHALGLHNIYNALASIAVGICCGISLEIMKNALYGFEGVERRLEIISKIKGANIIHDYAHHPDEIIASIKAVKDAYGGKIVCIFQPHTFSRTRDLYYEFCHCFIEADEVWLLPIYPAREKPVAKITSKFLAKGVSKYNSHVRYFSNFEKCFAFISKIAEDNMTFLIMGAGDICNLAYKFKKSDK